MIFVNNAREHIGDSFLIVNLKANKFFNDKNLRREDFDQLLKVVLSRINLPKISNAQRNNLLLNILYNQFDYSNEAIQIYKREFENKEKLDEKINQGTQIEQMHMVFNLIEIEIKMKLIETSDLKKLFNSLIKYAKMEKDFEDYLLFKFYASYLKHLLKENSETIGLCNELIVDLNKRKDLITTNLLKYLQIRNILLLIKSLESLNAKNSRQEIISNLDSLFGWTRGVREDLAIAIGMKWHNLQAEEMNYTECVNILNEMLKVLHRETLFGRSHKNIANQYLHIYTLLALYNSMLNKKDDLDMNLKGMDKSLSFIKNSKNKSQIAGSFKSNYSGNSNYGNAYNRNSEGSNEIINKYEFYGLVLKSIIKDNKDIKNEESSNIINNFKSSTMKEDKFYPSQMERDFLNLYLMSKNDKNIEEQFLKIEQNCENAMRNKENLSDDKLIVHYFYLYNSISLLSHKLMNNLNNNDIAKARDYAQLIINYTYSKIYASQKLRELFQLPFFKKLFNRINFIYIYSFYLEGKYSEALKNYSKYENEIKFQFELKSEQSSYLQLKKIRADCLFKLGNFEEALGVYRDIIGEGGEDPKVYMGLAASAALLGRREESLTAAEKFKEIVSEKDKGYNNNGLDMKQEAEELVKKIEQM